MTSATKAKIQKALKRAENEDRSLVFETLGQLYRYIGIEHDTYHRNKKAIEEAGFSVANKFDIEVVIQEALKRAKNEDRTLEFESGVELYRYLGITKKTYYKYRGAIEESGFSVANKFDIEVAIQEAFMRAENEDRTLEFESGAKLCEYIGIDKGTYRRHKKAISEAGFSLADHIANKIQEALERAESEKRTLEFYRTKELCEYIGIAAKTYRKYKKSIEEAGFLVVAKFDIETILQEALKKAELEDRSLEFPSYKKLYEYIGVSYGSYPKYLEEIEKAGFSVPELIMYKLQEALKRAESEDRMLQFESGKELYKYIEISEPTFYRYQEEIEEAGFSIAKSSLTANTKLTIKDCQAYGVKLENIALLPLCGRELFNRDIRSSTTQLEAWEILNKNKITAKFDSGEILAKIKNAVGHLLADDKPDYSLLELKLELFRGGAYFSEASIQDALMALGEKVCKESFEKWLRASALFSTLGLIRIEYVDELPLINTSDSGSVLIDKAINNKESLIELWREYVLFAAKNGASSFVSKTKIRDGWDGGLDELLHVVPTHEKAYLLDQESVDFLTDYKYDGILALAEVSSKRSNKDVQQVYQATRARCIGFFLFLNRKGLALFHPDYLVFGSGIAVTDIAEKILDKHTITQGYKNILDSDNTPKRDLKMLAKSTVHLHVKKLASAIKFKCDPSIVPIEHIYSYLESTTDVVVSKAMIHKTFTLTIFRLLGNSGAIEPQKKYDLDADAHVKILKSTDKKYLEALKNYANLVKQMIAVIRDSYRQGLSKASVGLRLKQVNILLRFLSIFPKKLGRSNMSKVLNTVIVSEDLTSFAEWGKERLSDHEYSLFTHIIYTLFDAIEDPEYKSVYNKGWRQKNTKKKRGIKREGLDPVVFEALKRVAFYAPPQVHDTEYFFRKTTPQGEPIDLSWWPFDFSPILPVCNWLFIKTARRKATILNLDIRSFLQYDQQGNLKSFYFNTDKNDQGYEAEVDSSLLNMIFTSEELVFLEHYVGYIKKAYSDRTTVKYSKRPEVFDSILPLFPHHQKNDVLQEDWFDGYHNKLLMRTQLILRDGVEKGEFDTLYAEHERSVKLLALKDTELVAKHKSNKRCELPCSSGEIDVYSSRDFLKHFGSKQGAHNMRHAGITEMSSRMPLHLVRIIAGHADINTTMRVYLHASESIVGKEIHDFGDKMTLDEPARNGYLFIENNLMPLIESNDPQMIEKMLLENDFICVDKEVRTVGAKKEVINGIKYASGIHPASWTVYNHGFCPKNGCPAESRGVCGLCPYLFASVMNIEGIIFKLNKCFVDSSLVALKLSQDIHKGTNTTRDELTATYSNLIEEIKGWTRLLRVLENKICQSEERTNALVQNRAHSAVKILSFGQIGTEEAMAEQLIHAASLNIDDVDHDNYIARLTHNVTRVAIRNHDQTTLQKIEQSGIQWFLKDYGKKAVPDRKKYLQKHMSVDGQPGVANVFELLEKPNQLLSS